METSVITIPKGLHASEHENGGRDEISVTGLSGLLADDQHVLDAEVDLRVAQRAVGSYTGDGTNNRQITTGFQCALVIVYDTTASDYPQIAMTNITFEPDSGLPGVDFLIHATDGFVVDNADCNYNAHNYEYFALSV